MHWSDHSNVSPSEFVGTPPAGSILGAAVIYQQVCVSVGVEVDTAWDALVSAVEALPDPTVETSPAVQGVTGLDSWFWFTGPTTVGPVAVSWTDPTVGTTFDLEGRAWVGSVRWDVEPGIDLWATSNGYFDTSGVLGGREAPNATWTYEVSSADAGFPDGYPVTMAVTWEGEWRWRERGGPWEPWRPMASTATIEVGRDYPVLEVVGVLDPP